MCYTQWYCVWSIRLGEMGRTRKRGGKGMGERKKKTQNKRTGAHLFICCNIMSLLRNAVKEIFDEEKPEVKQDVAMVSWEDLPEDGYFAMYTHFSIHETMLKVRNIYVSSKMMLIDPHNACRRILVVSWCVYLVFVVCVPVTILENILFICSQRYSTTSFSLILRKFLTGEIP